MKTELTPESAVEEGREFSEIKLRMIQEKTHKVAIMNHPPVDEIHMNIFCEEEKVELVITEVPTEEIIARTELFPEYQNPEIEKEISVEVFMVPCPVETKINEFCKAEEVQIVSTNIPTEEVILKTELTPESAVEEGKEFSEIKLRMIQEKTHNIGITNHPPVDEIHNGFCEEEKMDLVTAEIPIEEIITKTDLFLEYQTPEIEKEISVEVFKVPCPVETKINEFCKAEEVQIVSANIPTEEVILKTELTPESAVEEGREFSEIKLRMIQEKTHKVAIMNHPPVDEIHINGFCEEKMDFVITEIPTEEIITRTELFPEYQNPEIEKEISVEVFKVPCPVETKINEFCKAEEVQIVSTNIPTEEVILKTELTPESAVEEGREFSEIKLRMIQEKTHKVAIMNHPPVDEIHMNIFCEEEKVELVITEVPTEEIIARTELFPEYQNPEIEKEISVEVFMVPCPVETKINEFCKAEEVQIVSTNIPTEEVILKTELTPESAVEEGKEFSEIKLRMIQEKTHNIGITNHPPVDEIHNGFCEEEKMDLVTAEIPIEEIITKTDLFLEYQTPEIEKEISVEVFKVPFPIKTKINGFCREEEIEFITTDIPTEEIITQTKLRCEHIDTDKEKVSSMDIVDAPCLIEAKINGFCREEEIEFITTAIPTENIVASGQLTSELTHISKGEVVTVGKEKKPAIKEIQLNVIYKDEEFEFITTETTTEETITQTHITPKRLTENEKVFSETNLNIIRQEEAHVNEVYSEDQLGFVTADIPTDVGSEEIFNEIVIKEVAMQHSQLPPENIEHTSFTLTTGKQSVSSDISLEDAAEPVLMSELQSVPVSQVEIPEVDVDDEYQVIVDIYGMITVIDSSGVIKQREEFGNTTNFTIHERLYELTKLLFDIKTSISTQVSHSDNTSKEERDSSTDDENSSNGGDVEVYKNSNLFEHSKSSEQNSNLFEQGKSSEQNSIDEVDISVDFQHLSSSQNVQPDMYKEGVNVIRKRTDKAVSRVTCKTVAESSTDLLNLNKKDRFTSSDWFGEKLLITAPNINRKGESSCSNVEKQLVSGLSTEIDYNNSVAKMPSNLTHASDSQCREFKNNSLQCQPELSIRFIPLTIIHIISELVILAVCLIVSLTFLL